MNQTRRSTPPSTGEVAFRFAACTGIALALYYTPDPRWTSTASSAPVIQADAVLQVPARDATRSACASPDDEGRRLDAAVTAN